MTSRLMKAIRSIGKPTDPAPTIAQASRFSDDQIAKVLKFGVSYATSLPLKPNRGTPSEALKSANDIEKRWMRWFLKENQLEERDLIDAAARDAFQIPHGDNREHYCEGNDFLYWMTGYQDFRGIAKLAAEHSVNGGRFFDFGGSTGRLFRHFLAQSTSWDVWSCDFKQTSVDFNVEHFPNAKTFLNNSYPSLPIPDGYFDLISACSVFTHVNETETAWLLELRRTMKIGGIACLSIHNDHTWTSAPDVIRGQLNELRPDIANLDCIPPGKTVISWRDDDPYNCNVFHSDDYIRRNWGRFFEVLAIHPLYLGWDGKQAMVVLRRID